MKAEPSSERILILAPTGRDAEVTEGVLRSDGLACEPCADVGELARGIGSGAGGLVVAEEALTAGNIEHLAAALERQEPWSDLPVLVATSPSGSRAAHERIQRHLGRAGTVTIMERPIPTTTLRTAVQSMLSARRRQYQRRDLVLELRTSIAELHHEREIRERFAAIVTHDLRGPLATAKLSADILAQSPMPPDRLQQLAQRMTRSLDQMDRMIRDLLDTHRLEAGKGLPLQLDRCDLGKLARETSDELGTAYGACFAVRSEARVEGIWSADQLHRALWNLGTNAIKYGMAGAPIDIAVETSAEGVDISVHNEGSPIPPDEQATLFDAFDRSEAARAGAVRGWGLGLALVRACAEAHGGTVAVHSQLGRGTTFTIRLPWDATPFQPADQPPDAARADHAP